MLALYLQISKSLNIINILICETWHHILSRVSKLALLNKILKHSLALLVGLSLFVSVQQLQAQPERKEALRINTASSCGERSSTKLSSFKHNDFVAIDEVVRGDSLQGITRMSGNCMVLFNLQVMSVMQSSSPGEGSILAEIKSKLFQETGVLAGMSGSPVYLNKRLVGAVAYTVPNLKKPIVGITPINAMLRIGDYVPKTLASNGYNIDVKSETQINKEVPAIVYSEGQKNSKKSSLINSFGNISSLGNRWEGDYLLDDYANVDLGGFLTGDALVSSENIPHVSSQVNFSSRLLKNKSFLNALGNRMQPIPMSLVVSSLGVFQESNFKKLFNFGHFLTQRNSSGNVVNSNFNNAKQRNPGIALASQFPSQARHVFKTNKAMERVLIVPGDLIGVNLVRGDIDISAYGTVTYVDGNRVFAFGHPMDLAGPTAMPMYKAFVDSVVPRTDFSYKVGSLVEEIGSIVEDRKTAILGLVGKVSQRVPFSIAIDTKINKKTLQFEVAKGLEYGPEIFATLINLSLEQYESLAFRAPLNYKLSVELGIPDKKYDLRFSNTFPAQPLELTSRKISLEVFSKLQMLKENNFVLPSFEKIDVTLQQPEIEDVWQLDRVQLPKMRFQTGMPLKFSLVVKSYRGETKSLTVEFNPRRPLPPGVHVINVASESTFLEDDKLMNPTRYIPENFEEMIEQIQIVGSKNVLLVSAVVEGLGYGFNDEIYMHLPYNAVQNLSQVPSTKKSVVMNYETMRVPLEQPLFGKLSFPIEITPEY